jgi:hypothetical protein
MKAGALLLLLHVLLGCASRPLEESVEPVPYLDYPTAKMLDAPPCPAEMREGIEGLSASDDWRLVEGPGIRHCVPAHWQRREYGIGDLWYGGKASVVARRTSVNQEFGPTSAGGTRIGYVQKTIDGAAAEMWYMRRTDEAAAARQRGDYAADVYTRGYESFAIWRAKGLALTGSATSTKDIETLRRIYQTVRFDK